MTDDSDDELEDLTPDEDAADDVKGGIKPAPSGPVPIPYPNTSD